MNQFYLFTFLAVTTAIPITARAADGIGEVGVIPRYEAEAGSAEVMTLPWTADFEATKDLWKMVNGPESAVDELWYWYLPGVPCSIRLRTRKKTVGFYLPE